jgi:prepilin-type N-terminal cleavage/methylation domain-containing protein
LAIETINQQSTINNQQSNMRNNRAFTLVELLVSIAILAIIMTGLYQALATAISTHADTKEKQALLAQARYAMERMVMFVRETDSIEQPDSASPKEILKVSERLLDNYDNTTHAYKADGDGFLDADNDSDLLANKSTYSPDPKEYINFDLDKTDANNWKLMEEMPDYSTSLLSDLTPKRVICEHVTAFTCSLFATNLVEILLTLNNAKSEVTLKTRLRARLIE